MEFNLFWIDFFMKDHLFGFGLFQFHNMDEGEDHLPRNLFALYYNDGEILIDIFWVRVYENFPFWFWWFYKEEE